MNMKKYEILMDKEYTIEFEGRTLHRIRALKDFGGVKKGDLGGFVENENNLSHYGSCWIYDDAKAMDNSRIYGDSRMYDNSEMYNNSKMYGDSVMYNNSKMYNDSVMCDNSEMHNNSKMYGDSVMYNNSKMYNDAKLYGRLISKADDFMEINNPQGRLVTCVKKGDEILYNVGCQEEITEETFIWRIEHENGGLEKHPYRKYYYKIIEMAKLYFDVK